MNKPVLIFTYGNLSRGDDALGPLLYERLKDKIDSDTIEILTDFQLQIEHALDLEDRQLVLFVDASVIGKTAFNFSKLQADKDNSYTTHAMNPSAILQVYKTIKQSPPPPCFLLSIKGLSFKLGDSLTEQAKNNLQKAEIFAERLLNKHELTFWNQQLEFNFA